jgi:hypothetical protein
MTQTVHGWNLSVLRAAIEDAIRSTGYGGVVAINFEVRSNRVVVRPDSRLSRALSNAWLKILLICAFVYPSIWLYMRDGSRGDGHRMGADGAYALNQWIRPSSNVQPGTRHNMFQTPDGSKDAGQRAGR